MNSTKRTARIAGLLYLVFAIISILSFLYIPSTFTVSGNATATADNIVSSEFLYRTGIYSNLISMIVFIFLVLALYRLFKEVDPMPAILMVTLVVIGISAEYLNTFNKIAALIILSGDDFLSVFAEAQLDALAYLFLRLYNQAGPAIQIFWGLWLFPFGLLVIKSRFIPKILGVLLMIAGFGYLLSSFTSLVLPQYKAAISPLTSLLAIGELPIIFWLLVVGAKAQSVEYATPSAA